MDRQSGAAAQNYPLPRLHRSPTAGPADKIHIFQSRQFFSPAADAEQQQGWQWQGLASLSTTTLGMEGTVATATAMQCKDSYAGLPHSSTRQPLGHRQIPSAARDSSQGPQCKGLARGI